MIEEKGEERNIKGMRERERAREKIEGCNGRMGEEEMLGMNEKCKTRERKGMY